MTDQRPSPINERIRQNIRGIAKLKRIGMYELASDAGCHYDTINKFLKRDTKSIAVDKLERIADALGFTVVGLIQWRGK